MIDIKHLKKIAAACRKAGILQYKCQDFEIVISQEAPVKIKRSRTKTAKEDLSPDNLDIPDELTAEQLLSWSAGSDLGLN